MSKLQVNKNGWIELMCEGLVGEKIKICARCGAFLKTYAGEFQVDGKRYRLCSQCLASSVQSMVDGSILGLIRFERWDDRLETLRIVESALLDYHLRDVN